MATVVSHVLLGWGAYRFADAGRDPRRLGPAVAGALSMLPDADTLLMRWIPYEAMSGHRGLSHSLAVAALVGVLAAAALRHRVAFPGGFWGLAGTLAAITASHGLLDAMTDGGLGIAFFAPFSAARHFLPIQPIPVSPITVNVLDPWVLRVLAVEALLLWPWALLLGVARTPAPRWLRIVAAVAALASVACWVVRCR